MIISNVKLINVWVVVKPKSIDLLAGQDNFIDIKMVCGVKKKVGNPFLSNYSTTNSLLLTMNHIF